METPFCLCVPAAKHIVVSGDIHGEFNTLVYKLCVQYKMRDTLLIVAGDCGFGFEKPEYYRSIFHKLIDDGHPVSNWFYGHFHQSWNADISGVRFKMLDIMEFATIGEV